MNQNRFFIYSLARSRTSWLSAWLTTGDSICLHEAANKVDALDHLPSYMNSFPHRHVGNSDCFNIVILEDLRQMFPAAYSTVIRRPFEDVINSLKKAGIPYHRPLMKKWFEDLEELAKEVPSFDFNDLGSWEVARDIWHMTLPGIPFDRDRFELMSSIRMEPAYLRAGVVLKPWAIEYVKREAI